ncbi:hypothetical protein SAMN03159496_05725 [Rhizobium sp. NFR07]|nr:hypothetical protein SAMN03159496_05725 [Rhizobium sp. NFR07]
MYHRRYDLREEGDGTWTVFDIFTGVAAEVFDEPLIGLDLDEAEDIIQILNRVDRQRVGSWV